MCIRDSPWSDGFAMVSPVDYYGEQGRNGFGLADMLGGVWEFTLDHFDPKGGHEDVHYADANLCVVVELTTMFPVMPAVLFAWESIV